VLNAIGYDANTKQLGFNLKPFHSLYFYHVPFQVFNELMAAPSKGDYYHRYIEGNYKG
jgi:hypothetical protein